MHSMRFGSDFTEHVLSLLTHLPSSRVILLDLDVDLNVDVDENVEATPMTSATC